MAPAVLLRSPRARPLHRFTAGLIDVFFVPLIGLFLLPECGYWLPIVIGAAWVAALAERLRAHMVVPRLKLGRVAGQRPDSAL